jgi:hypothetical protein
LLGVLQCRDDLGPDPAGVGALGAVRIRHHDQQLHVALIERAGEQFGRLAGFRVGILESAGSQLLGDRDTEDRRRDGEEGGDGENPPRRGDGKTGEAFENAGFFHRLMVPDDYSSWVSTWARIRPCSSSQPLDPA